MDYLFLLLVGFCAATLGGMIGVGGGFLLVPFLCYYWPQATPATATSNFVLMISATVGVVTHLACGRDLGALSHALAAGAGALAGGAVAATLARRVSGRFLMLLFAAVQLLIGARMVLPVVL
jgi:uncharacterized membrane protein YfcA